MSSKGGGGNGHGDAEAKKRVVVKKKREEDAKRKAVVAKVKSEMSGSSKVGFADEVIDVEAILGDALEYVEDPKLGQKKPTPSPGSGIRVFYESLVRFVVAAATRHQ